MDIAELWDICIGFMWGEEYLKGLYSFLRENNVKSAIDCGGGTGFPSIELKKMGWDVTYADESKVMFERFRKKTAADSICMPCYLTNWLELTKNIPRKFDAVLCRGNSLVYVNSWDRGQIGQVQEGARCNILAALRQFRKILNKGGVLYVDLTNRREFDRPNYPIIEDFGGRTINGKKAKLVWEMTHDYENKIRVWKAILTIGGKKYEFENYSYPLRHKELIGLMKEAGFRNVHEAEIVGENNYNVFVGYK